MPPPTYSPAAFSPPSAWRSPSCLFFSTGNPSYTDSFSMFLRAAPDYLADSYASHAFPCSLDRAPSDDQAPSFSCRDQT